MNPIRMFRIYRAVSRVARQLEDAAVSKSLFASKTFWINLIPALLELAQVVGDARLVPTEYLLVATTVLNIVNRLLTTQPVHLVAPK